MALAASGASGAVLVGDDIAPTAFLETDWSAGGAIALMRGSTTSHVAMLARARGIPMVVGAAVRQMLAVTKARFGADSDFTFVAKVLEEWAGIEIRG